jgi:hypothetical protein
MRAAFDRWRSWLASGQDGFLKLAKVDSAEEATLASTLKRKFLKRIQKIARSSRGGFQLDSPVKKPDASEMARSSPPYTF